MFNPKDYPYQLQLVCRYLVDGTLVYTNEVFDFYFKSAGQQYILDFMPFVRREQSETLWRRAGDAEQKPMVYHLEHKVILEDQQEHWLHWAIYCGYDDANTLVEFEAVGNDITEKKLLEQQSLELALEKERSRLIHGFIVGMSHDFRTPLSIINTSLYLLMKATDPEKRQYHKDLIEKQVARVTKLVDDLITITTLENTSELDLSPVDLNSLVRDVVSVQRALAEDHNQTIEQEYHPEALPVLADKLALGQAITHIVENAIQYTPRGGTIRLRTSHRGLFAVVEVEDTGVGIEESELSRIFERLYKGDVSRTPKDSGIGLGLPIANAILQKHGGKIEVDSTFGEGSLFRLLIPFRQD